jgi:hypothetical protein
MSQVLDCRVYTKGGFVLDLETYPYAQLQNLLELLGSVIPPVVVAGRVRRQVVLGGMTTAATVRYDVVSLPQLGEFSAADVAAPSRLGQDHLALSSRKGLTRRP